MQEEYNPDLVQLSDDDGNEYNFEVLDAIESDDGRYVAMTPCNEDGSPVDDDDGSLIIMKVIEENGDNFFEEIEDDDEYETIAESFVNRLQEFYEIDDK